MVDGSAPFQGEKVTCTGRFATMSRLELGRLVESLGGRCENNVTRETTLLVVGQDGWALQDDGKLTRKLQKAQWLQRSGQELEILSEESFLQRAGMDSEIDGIHRVYSTAQLSKILGVPGHQIRRWAEHGLIAPVSIDAGISYFDFSQVAGARAVCQLLQNGVSPQRLKRSVEQLGQWFEDDESSTLLPSLLQDGRLLVRLSHGKLAEPDGQLQLTFPEDEPAREETVTLEQPHQPGDWLDLAYVAEDAENWHEAIEAYRQALLVSGPDSELSFNLANALHQTGQRQAALERFSQAVEIDNDFVEAWNNLGNVLAEMQEYGRAEFAFHQALRIDPNYSEAHYNLASTLEEAGEFVQAQRHWKSYLGLVQFGTHADYARSRVHST